MVLDSQRLSTLLPKEFLSKGFKVFVTLPGVSTSKVPFLVDPSFQGEHNFFIHGIHVIKVNFIIYLGSERSMGFFFEKKIVFFSVIVLEDDE